MGKQQRQDNDPDDDEEDDEEIEGEENEDDDEDDDGDATGKKGESKSKSPDKKFSEAEVESIVRRRLSRAKRKIRSEVQQELAAKPDGDGDDELKNQIKDLNSRIADLEDLEELAEERYEQDLMALPEEIRDLAPDDDEPILVKERWLVTKGRPAAEKLRAKSGNTNDKGGDDNKGESKTRSRGNNPKDPPNRRRKDEGDPKQKLRDQARQSGKYRPIL